MLHILIRINAVSQAKPEFGQAGVWPSQTPDMHAEVSLALVIYTLLLSLLAIWLWDKGKCRTMQGRLRRIYRQSRSKAGTLSYRVRGIPAVACVYSISDFSGVTWMNSPALRRAGRSAK